MYETDNKVVVLHVADWSLYRKVIIGEFDSISYINSHSCSIRNGLKKNNIYIFIYLFFIFF